MLAIWEVYRSLRDLALTVTWPFSPGACSLFRHLAIVLAFRLAIFRMFPSRPFCPHHDNSIPYRLLPGWLLLELVEGCGGPILWLPRNTS
jgi:hypothetical protein